MSFSHYYYNARHVTNQLLEAADEQVITQQQIAEAALGYMSESDVARMARDGGFLELLDDESDD